MAVIAVGSKTIIDLSDGKLISMYLSSNHPTQQRYNSNLNANPIFLPNWNISGGVKLIITPNISVNYNTILLSDPNITSIKWSIRDGIDSPSTPVGNPYGSAAYNIPTATPHWIYQHQLETRDNALFSSASGMLTYIAEVTYHDPDTLQDVVVSANITFTMVTVGSNAKTVMLSGPQVIKYAGGLGTPSPTSLPITA